MIRTSQLLIALLFPLSLFAAGHEVSAVRYAPNDSFAGAPSLASSGNRFLALWPISSQIFGAVSDPASDIVPQAFTAVPFANTSTLRLTNAGSGYVAIWSQTFQPPAIATFTSAGVLQRRAQLDVAALSNPRLASNGTRLLVVDQLPGLPSTPTTTDLSVYDLTGQISESGVLLCSSFARSDGPPDLSAGPPVPSIAANDAQDTAFVISEIAPPWYVARARLYLMSEMAPMPAPPPAPRNVVSDFGGGSTRIEWQSDGADGFVLEQSLDFGKSWIPVVVTGDVRSATIHFGFPGNQFRVSAFGPGGLSAGTITSIGSPQRRHATSR